MPTYALRCPSVDINPAALASIRQLSGMSQAELSRRTTDPTVSQGHISRIEAGEKQASPATIKALAEALGVPIAAIASVRYKDPVS